VKAQASEPEVPVPEPSLREPSKSKPLRHGLAWKDDEVIRMLMAIRKKKTIKEIAETHERTSGGVHSKLKSLAVEYFYNDEKPISEIEKITGLSTQVIQYAVNKKKSATP
jgi:hypothetical protein